MLALPRWLLALALRPDSRVMPGALVGLAICGGRDGLVEPPGLVLGRATPDPPAPGCVPGRATGDGGRFALPGRLGGRTPAACPGLCAGRVLGLYGVGRAGLPPPGREGR